MPLNNSQYDAIIRTYEEKQTRNRHILEERRAYVYAHIDGYREMDDSIASISVEQQSQPSCRRGFSCRLPGTHLRLSRLQGYRIYRRPEMPLFPPGGNFPVI